MNFFLKKIYLACQEKNVPCISQETAKFLIHILTLQKPMQVCEIGSAHGFSTFTIASTIMQWGGHITSFEISAPSYKQALKYKREGGYSNVDFIFGDPLKKLKKTSLNQTFDFIFIDAQKNKTKDFLAHMLLFFKPGGVIIIDDVIKFRWKMGELDEFLQSQKLDFYELQTDPDDGVGCVFLKEKI